MVALVEEGSRGRKVERSNMGEIGKYSFKILVSIEFGSRFNNKKNTN